jgi:purine-binding chemotaxis protein CheW
MSNQLAVKTSGTVLDKSLDGTAEFVTMVIGGQSFGIPVLEVRDVLGPQRLTRIPLAPPEVAGSLNLRGRIVTAIDMRARLGMPPLPPDVQGMNIVVDYKGELYSLIVDKVGEVMSLSDREYEKNPMTLDSCWQSASRGIYRLKDALLIVLDTARLMRIENSSVV